MALVKNSLPWPTSNHRVTSPFGPRKTTKDKFHDGTDFGAIKPGVSGDPLYAISLGEVVYVGMSSSYGLYVIIQHTGFCSLYAHMNLCSLEIGDTVYCGQVVGIMGDSGTEATHLHFELRSGNYNATFWAKVNDKFKNSVDPELYLKEEGGEPQVPNTKPEVPRVYDPSLVSLVEHDPPIFDSPDYWQNLIDDKANMSQVSVKTFIDAMAKIVKND